MKRRESASATAAQVDESFAEHLDACPAPREGWASDPHAIRLRAVVYVRRHALADGRSPYAVADEIAAAWLRGAA